MLTSKKAAMQQRVVGLKESGYKFWPYIHTDLWRAPVTFFWWATTPSGRQSRVHWHSHTFYRLMSSGKLRRTASGGDLATVYLPSAHYRISTMDLRNQLLERQSALLPSLPRGYEWQGPFLYSECSAPQIESDSFSFREPQRNEGIPMVYTVPAQDPLSIAQRIATQVLSERRVPA